MSKRKPMDKTQARERRNRLLESAAAAELSLTEGVREMRAIAGMTQDEFARHRGVSARAIKALELGQGNPTVATLNRIGHFFGLEVAFVPIKRSHATATTPDPASSTIPGTAESGLHRYPKHETAINMSAQDFDRTMAALRESILANARHMAEVLDALENTQQRLGDAAAAAEPGTDEKTGTKKRKRRST